MSETPATPPPPVGGPAPGPAVTTGQSGFWKRLFDLSFAQSITPTITKIVYVVSIVLISLLAVIYLLIGLAAAANSDAPAVVVVVLIVVPLVWLLLIIGTRMWLELFIAVIRTADNTQRLVEGLVEASQGGTASPGWHPDPDGGGGWRYWDGSSWTAASPQDVAATGTPPT